MALLRSHLVIRPSALFTLRRTTHSLWTETTGQNRRNTQLRRQPVEATRPTQDQCLLPRAAMGLQVDLLSSCGVV